jgi:hypothetical protein
VVANRSTWTRTWRGLLLGLFGLAAVAILVLPCLTAVASIVVTVMVKNGHPVSFGTLQILNPYATLFNALGILKHHPGLAIGASQAMCWPGSMVGLPVAGGLLFWLLPSLSFLIGADEGMAKAITLGIPLCFIGQFTVQRAFLDAANELQHQAAATPVLAERLEPLEGRMLETTVRISRATGCIGVFFDDQAFQPMIRLSELEARGHATPLSPLSFPRRTRMRGITIDFQAREQGVDIGKTARQFSHFQNFERVTTTLDSGADVSALRDLGPFDALLQIAMSTVLDVAVDRELLERLDRFQPTFDPYLIVDVEDTSPHDADVDRGVTVGGDGSLEVKSTFDHRNKITVFINMAVYRARAAQALASLARLDAPGEVEAYHQLAEWTTRQVNGPLAHELWHFFASKSVSFRGLPLALDEGFATLLQTLSEGMDAAGAAHADAISKSAGEVADPETRKAIIASVAATPSPTEEAYLTLLTTKKPWPTESLLRLGDQEIHDTLPYAQGWLLALSTCFERETIQDIAWALESPERGARVFSMGDSLFQRSRDGMIAVRQGCMGTITGVGSHE